MPSQPGLEPADGLLQRAKTTLAEACAKPLPAGLYLVATPIGNLADISLRALSVLANADLIACEDTRHSGKLLKHYDIRTPLLPYHEHNAGTQRPKLLRRLADGASLALISDAGTPLISDPGYKLTREAAAAGIAVVAIPGPSASLAALSVSGLPTDSFFFAGFLPPKSAGRKTRIEALAQVPGTLIFYETGPRLAACLADLAETLRGREAAVAKELTKLHENVARGSLPDLASSFAGEDAPRGEFVVLVGPPAQGEGEADEAAIEAALRQALDRMSVRDAVKSVMDELKLKRAQVYPMALRLADDA
jgi:16S rRNA (cytidine1402-2'-O)-methyltransferase